MVTKESLLNIAVLASQVNGCLVTSIAFLDKLISENDVRHNMDLAALLSTLRVLNRLSGEVAEKTLEVSFFALINKVGAKDE